MTDTTTTWQQQCGRSRLGRRWMNRVSAEQLVSQARAKGIELVGPDGLLSQLTKRVLEAALEAEMSDDLGYDFECALARAGRSTVTNGPPV